eukprot:jgi/Picsp_1/72/NSC_00072-R1_mannosyl phosphorylinositol ceramide synthase sur1
MGDKRRCSSYATQCALISALLLLYLRAPLVGDVVHVQDTSCENDTNAVSEDDGRGIEKKELNFDLLNGLDNTMRIDPNKLPHVSTGIHDQVAVQVEGNSMAEFMLHTKKIMEEGYMLLHQTWKDSCILDCKIPFMKTWASIHSKLKVIFWTDDTMDAFMSTAFKKKSKIAEAWELLSQAKASHIKRADLFRIIAVWYYSGVYSDLDIEIKTSLQPLLDQNLTCLVYEPENAMAKFTSYSTGDAFRTQILSGIMMSGIRHSDFLGFLINWIVESHLQGLVSPSSGVLEATGPRIQAIAYKYYVQRAARHDTLLRVMSYIEFESHYGAHHTKSTWIMDDRRQQSCTQLEDNTIYPEQVVIFPRF